MIIFTKTAKKKRVLHIAVNKYTILLNFLIMTMIIAPMTMRFTLDRPLDAVYALGKISLGAARAYEDSRKLIVRTTGHIVHPTLKKAYRRYGLEANHQLAQQVTGKQMYAQPESLKVKTMRSLNPLRLFRR